MATKKPIARAPGKASAKPAEHSQQAAAPPQVGIRLIWNIFQWRSLKTRVTIFTLAIFVLSIWVLAFFTNRMLREDTQQLLSEQQFSTASIVAAEINQGLVERINALEAVARTIDYPMLEKPAAIQKKLSQLVALPVLFNAGVHIVGRDGVAIADMPTVAGRIGTDYSFSEAVHAALTEGKTTIDRPQIGPRLKQPEFFIVTAIRDAHAKVVAALIGTTDLSKPHFLDSLTGSRYGKTGGYLLVAPQHRLIVTATDKSRIMQASPTPGLYPLFDRFLQGYEGSGVEVNSSGVEVLASAKSVPVAGWYVNVALPTSEAFAHIKDMQRSILQITIVLTMLAAGLTWWMIKRQLAPMLATVETLASLSDANRPTQPLPITSRDEIGDLIGGFNRLLEALAIREKALNKSEAQNRAITQSAYDAVITSGSDGNILGWNHGAETIFGYAESEIMGQPMTLLIPERYRGGHLEGMNRIRCGGEHRIIGKTVELSGLRKDGSEFPLELSLAKWELADGWFITGILRDITERKQMEDQVRQLAFYDTLTELANRRLLNDRLRQAIAASKRNEQYGALMFLDLDNFKPLNDTHGHEVGDLLLIEAASRLKNCVRTVDTVARFGGDEFVVMINELDADKSESATKGGFIAEKIHAALAKPYVLQVRHEGTAEITVEHRCTASIGVALFGKNDTSQEDVLKRADTAMYQAKAAGRNLIRFYDVAGT